MLGFAGIVQSGNRGTPLLLDTYSGAAAAYSLRRLRTAYTGSAVRVRRSLDSVEQDIGFDTNGNLDESSLQTFCGENLVQRSEEFDNAYWTKADLSVSANSTTAPDGQSTADKIIENTSNAVHAIYKDPFSFNSGNTYTFSCYIKAAERQYATIQFYHNGASPGARYTVLFDLTNGTVVTSRSISGQTGTYSISSAGNGWYRCAASISMNVGAQGTVHVFISNSSTPTWSSADGPIYTGNGTSGIYIWGAQLNNGSLKPYVQTTSATRDGIGYVTKWFDQSGNARDAEQTTAANQPRIVNAGVVEKQKNKPSIFYNGSNNNLTITDFNYSSYSYLTLFSSLAKSSDKGGQMLMNHGDYDLRSTFAWWIDFNAINGFTSDLGTLASINWISTNTKPSANQFVVLTYQIIIPNSAADKQLFYVNGTQLSTSLNGTYNKNTTTIYNSPDALSIGAERRNTGYVNYFHGYISDIILYNSDQSTSRTAIESNINTYFNIY